MPVMPSCICFAEEAILINVCSGEKVSQLRPWLWFWRDGHLAKNKASTMPVLILPLHLSKDLCFSSMAKCL